MGGSHVFSGHKASAILVQTHMMLKMLGELAGEHLKLRFGCSRAVLALITNILVDFCHFWAHIYVWTEIFSL